MPDGVCGDTFMVSHSRGLAGLQPEQASTPRRGDRPLGECPAAATEKEQAQPHATSVRRSVRAVSPPGGRVGDRCWSCARNALATAGSSGHAVGVEISQVDVHDDAAMLAWDRIWRAAHLAEDPTDPLTTTAEVIARARGPQASMHSEHWVLHVDDRRVGISEVDLPLLDNLDLAEVVRRRGWRFVKWAPLRRFLQDGEASLNGLEAVLGLEPAVEQTGHQLAFKW